MFDLQHKYGNLLKQIMDSKVVNFLICNSLLDFIDELDTEILIGEFEMKQSSAKLIMKEIRKWKKYDQHMSKLGDIDIKDESKDDIKDDVSVKDV